MADRYWFTFTATQWAAFSPDQWYTFQPFQTTPGPPTSTYRAVALDVAADPVEVVAVSAILDVAVSVEVLVVATECQPAVAGYRAVVMQVASSAVVTEIVPQATSYRAVALDYSTPRVLASVVVVEYMPPLKGLSIYSISADQMADISADDFAALTT
jgi:hypothetical protein